MPVRRRPVNKTFSGCARCKASKVKCDETKPSCNRCTSRRLPCPGYPGVVIRWSTKHEVFSSLKAPDPSFACEPTPSLAPDGLLPPESLLSNISPISQNAIPTPKTTLPRRRQSDTTSNTTSPFPTDNSTVILASAYEFRDFPDGSRLGNPTDFMSTGPSWIDASQSQKDYGWPSTDLVIPYKATSIPQTISHLPATLVSYYFQDVCSVFSSFDSELNPFRSYVSQVFSHSAPVFNAMLSSSAARLSDERPELKIVGLQYQSKALRCIAESLKQGNEIPEDTLFAIFLIGLSTAWHDGRDIGLAHFHAAQRAISSNLISQRGNNQSMIRFFKSALIYWEMAVSLVSDEVEFSFDLGGAVANKSDIAVRDVSELNARIVPHPWTGVSSLVQTIFSRVAKVIRSLRFVESLTDADLLRYQQLSEDAENLELALWSLSLPNIAEIDDSGDPNTPARHHILLAEAYIFAALYQIYRKFPDVLGRRRKYLSNSMSPQPCPESNPMAGWYSSLPSTAGDNTILRSLGIGILDRLRQIPITSGTRSVQAILIFVAAGSLEMPSPFTLLQPSLPVDQGEPLDALLELDRKRVMDLREFTIVRLSSLRKLVHSRPVDLMLQVIKEMYRRLDSGEEIFWIDVNHEMNCETMLG